MKDNYKEHAITASARQIRDTQQWQPKLVIWIEKGDYPIQTPLITKHFSTREQAESKDIAVAKKLIDEGRPSLF